MTSPPNRAKGSSHEVRFDANGVTVDAEYRHFTKSGRLSVWLDGTQVAEIDWMDYDPSYFTDAGLEKVARSEILQTVEFSADPANEVPADIAALAKRSLGLGA